MFIICYCNRRLSSESSWAAVRFDTILTYRYINECIRYIFRREKTRNGFIILDDIIYDTAFVLGSCCFTGCGVYAFCPDFHECQSMWIEVSGRVIPYNHLVVILQQSTQAVFD